MSAPAKQSGRRRHNIAILFCDLSDSTRIAAPPREPEFYDDLIERLRETQIEIVARHGGEIARFEGDGIICIFGYPQCHEDAGRRATETAIDFHAAAAALDCDFASGSRPIRLHSGIHAGVVLLSDGDIVRGRFEMRGDPTNVASKLCHHAESDEIIVSEAALGADRHFFQSGPRRHVRVNGHTQPVGVYNIFGREAPTTRFVARTRQGSTAFMGRAVEMARLRAWLAGGPKGLMLVAGPAGIGKTRLLAEVLGEAEAAAVTVHRSYCEAYLGARPLQPFTQLMRSITGDPDADLSDAAADSGLGPSIEVMRALLARAAEAGPCILAIDDWQLADGASREMLDALAAGAAPIGFLIASRKADPRLQATKAAGTIEMPPLSALEAEAVIAARLATPDPFLVRRIGEESGGYPLYIEELCHAPSRATGEMESDERNAALDMLIQARFADLPPEQATLVRAASVIGNMVPAHLFEAVTGISVGDPAVAALADADFVYPSEIGRTLRFKHGVTREAIYRAIGLEERQALHGRVVDALKEEAERRGEQSLLDSFAHHYAESGDPMRALPYAIRAGDAALAAGALDRAQDLCRTAFEIVVERGDEALRARLIWPLLHKYGLACIVDPAPDQLPLIREMARRLEALGHAAARVRGEYWIGLVAYCLGDARVSVFHLTAARRAAEDLEDTRFMPQIELKLAQSLFAAGSYAEADAMFTRVLDAISLDPGQIDDESHVYGLCSHGLFHADQGDFDAAVRRFAEADLVLGSTAPPMLASYLTQKSGVCLFRGEWAEALIAAQDCLAASERARTRYQAMMAKALGAYAQWQLDRDPAAVQTLVGAVRWFTAGASQQRTSLVYGWLADIMAESGRPDLARYYAARAIERVRRVGDRLGEAMAYRAVARVAAARGDGGRAGRYLAAACRSATIRGSPREQAQNRLCEAELALAAGDRARAGPMIEAARAAFAGMGMAFFADRAEAMLSASR